jgi:hypothetical protein
MDITTVNDNLKLAIDNINRIVTEVYAVVDKVDTINKQINNKIIIPNLDVLKNGLKEQLIKKQDKKIADIYISFEKNAKIYESRIDSFMRNIGELSDITLEAALKIGDKQRNLVSLVTHTTSSGQLSQCVDMLTKISSAAKQIDTFGIEIEKFNRIINKWNNIITYVNNGQLSINKNDKVTIIGYADKRNELLESIEQTEDEELLKSMTNIINNIKIDTSIVQITPLRSVT